MCSSEKTAGHPHFFILPWVHLQVTKCGSVIYDAIDRVKMDEHAAM